MVSRNISNHARLVLAFIFFTISTKNVVASSNTDKISITDFKHYRKISYKKAQVLIYKNSAIKGIFYVSNRNEQNYIQINGIPQLSLKVDTTTKNHRLVINNNKMSYQTKNKTIYFAESNSICEKKSLNESFLKLNTRQMLRSISAINVESLADETCTAEQKRKLGLYLSDILTTENSWLSACYSNDSVNKLIEADENYLKYTGSVYSKYLRLVDQINNNESPIQISCKIDQKNRIGSFDETGKRQKISFNFNELSKNSNSEDKLSENIKKTLGHELFHYGETMQTPEDTKYSSCINEEYARVFTEACNNIEIKKTINATKNKEYQSTEKIKIESSKEIVKRCEGINIISKQENTLEVDNGKDKNKAGLLAAQAQAEAQKVTLKLDDAKGKNKAGLPATQAAAAAQAQQQQAAVQTQLQQTVKASDFTQPSESDFATLVSQTTPNTQDGKAYTVSANSDFGKVVQNTMNSFAKSGNTLTAKLNSAIAVTTPTAQATTSTLANSSGVAPLSGKLAASTSTSNTEINPSSTALTKTQTPPPTENPTATKNSRMPATEEPTVVLKKLPSSAGQASELAGQKNAQSSGSGANTAATTRTITGAMQTTGTGNSVQNSNTNTNSSSANISSGNSLNNSRSPASLPSSNRPSQNTEGASLVKTIQSLKAFNTVSGGQYQEIKKYYTNPYFKNLLQTNDMRIVVKNENGQYVGIGVDSNQAKKVFNDDGQFLKAIEPKK